MENLTLLNQISFWLFAIMMIGGALGVVFHKSIVYSALLLLVTFLSIAGLFVLLNAPFIAAAQILVYGVGLTIVLIFGIMLTGDKPFVDPVGQERPKRYWLIPGVIAFAFMGFLLWSLLSPNYNFTAVNGLFLERVQPSIAETLPGVQAIIADGGVTHIGLLLFSKYLLPFELASVLLLLAMIGAIILSKRQFPEEEAEGEPHVSQDLDGGAMEGKSCCSLNEGNGNLASENFDSEKETLGVH